MIYFLRFFIYFYGTSFTNSIFDEVNYSKKYMKCTTCIFINVKPCDGGGWFYEGFMCCMSSDISSMYSLEPDFAN